MIDASVPFDRGETLLGFFPQNVTEVGRSTGEGQVQERAPADRENMNLIERGCKYVSTHERLKMIW